MKTLTHLVVASAGALLLALTLNLTNAGPAVGQSSKPQLVEVANTQARPVPVATTVASDHVTLVDDFGQTGECEFGTVAARILPDGTREPFVVPRGRVLVLTDIQGVVSSSGLAVWTATHIGHVATLTVRIQGTAQPWFFEARAHVNDVAVSGQIVPVESHLQSGIAAGPGSILCIRAFLSRWNSSFSADSRVRIQGYLLNQ